jgi:ABC-type antimicrobial peptide transport system permease subunit
MALGAGSVNVLVHVVREGLLLSLAGVVLGLLGSVVLSRGLETMIFGVTPTDTGSSLAARKAGGRLPPTVMANATTPCLLPTCHVDRTF